VSDCRCRNQGKIVDAVRGGLDTAPTRVTGNVRSELSMEDRLRLFVESSAPCRFAR
jgi:hypothetical protein